MMARLWIAILALAAGFGLAGAETALAVDTQNWSIDLQPAMTPIAEQMHDFDNLLLWVITIIVVFVMILLLYVMVRFREKRNPVPSRTVHNTLI